MTMPSLPLTFNAIGLLYAVACTVVIVAIMRWLLPDYTQTVTTHPEVLDEERKATLDAAFQANHPKFTPTKGKPLRPGFARDHHVVTSITERRPS